MESLPEYDVQPERDRFGIHTGWWIWEVFDAATQGPIMSGVEHTKERAAIVGASARNMEENRSYGCDGSCTSYEMLGLDACSGCCGRI